MPSMLGPRGAAMPLIVISLAMSGTASGSLTKFVGRTRDLALKDAQQPAFIPSSSVPQSSFVAPFSTRSLHVMTKRFSKESSSSSTIVCMGLSPQKLGPKNGECPLVPKSLGFAQKIYSTLAAITLFLAPGVKSARAEQGAALHEAPAPPEVVIETKKSFQPTVTKEVRYGAGAGVASAVAILFTKRGRNNKDVDEPVERSQPEPVERSQPDLVPPPALTEQELEEKRQNDHAERVRMREERKIRREKERNKAAAKDKKSSTRSVERNMISDIEAKAIRAKQEEERVKLAMEKARLAQEAKDAEAARIKAEQKAAEEARVKALQAEAAAAAKAREAARISEEAHELRVRAREENKARRKQMWASTSGKLEERGEKMTKKILDSKDSVNVEADKKAEDDAIKAAAAAKQKAQDDEEKARMAAQKAKEEAERVAKEKEIAAKKAKEEADRKAEEDRKAKEQAAKKDAAVKAEAEYFDNVRKQKAAVAEQIKNDLSRAKDSLGVGISGTENWADVIRRQQAAATEQARKEREERSKSPDSIVAPTVPERSFDNLVSALQGRKGRDEIIQALKRDKKE